jgi:hypothetical protein
MTEKRRPVRTYWQRFSLDSHAGVSILRPDYMGNAEYEFGSFPAAKAKLQGNLEGLEFRTLDQPFQIAYYPSSSCGQEPLAKPSRFTFIGAAEDLDACLKKLKGRPIDNKAGLLQRSRDSVTLLWLVVDPRRAGGGGYLVVNDSWIDELGLRDMVMEYVASYFGVVVPA